MPILKRYPIQGRQNIKEIWKLPFTDRDYRFPIMTFVQEKEGEIDLSFELALTGYCKLNDGEIYHAISDELRKINPAYHIETMIDRNFISGKIYGND